MANISQQNNIRYNIDTLDCSSCGVFISESIAPDCSNASTVKGFDLSYSEPVNTKIKILFNLSNIWYKLTTAGDVESITSATPDFDTIIQKGNSPADLLTLNNIPAFAGQKIGVAIALFSSDPNNAIPKIKLGIKCETDSQILNTSQYSPVYDFDEAQLIKFNTIINNTGTGNVAVFGQVKDLDGKISEWSTLENLNGKKITSLQLRADYSVNELANSSAGLTSAQFIYSQGNTITESYTKGDLISFTENWYMNLRECRMNIKHAPLERSNIRAYISLRQAPKIIHGENLGIGSGVRKTFQLANTNGIKYDSVKLYFDNVQTFSDYEINTQVGRITCNAPEGVIVSCDYEYDWGQESWQEMPLSSRISLMEYDQSEFKLTLDNNNYSVCAVKISLEMNSGTFDRVNVGRGTGKTQTYKLLRRVHDGKITLYENGALLPAKNYRLHDDTQYISITAKESSVITASYDWISESPVIYQFAAVFSE